jgi:predicted small lipoprotein YifL
MKKFLSMLLILALAASVFTACGDKPAFVRPRTTTLQPLLLGA